MKKVLFFILSVFLCTSCSKNDDISEPLSKSEKIEFIYKGTTYSSMAQLDANSNLIFDNKEVGDLYLSLHQLPKLATLVEIDKPVEYFDTSEELRAILDMNNQKSEATTPQPRGPRYDGDVTIDFYDQANFNGRHVGVTKQIWNGFWHIPLITEYYPEDCLRSIKILTRLESDKFRLNVIFHEDLNWGGKALAFRGFQNFTDPDFHRYYFYEGGVYKYWDKIISSFHIWFDYNE